MSSCRVTGYDSWQEIAKGQQGDFITAMEGNMTAKARTQKHREKLRALRRQRLEVHLPNDLIEAARTLARYHKRCLRDIVHSALKDYVTRHTGSMLGPLRTW